MKIKFFIKEVLKLSACFLLFIALYILYLSGIFSKFNNGNFTSLVFENAHTGLVKPAMKIAFDDQNRMSDKIAKVETPLESYERKTDSGQKIALDNMPVVLFDISIQPIFEKSNNTVLFLWIIVFVLVLLYSANLIRKIIKKAKINKIKKI